MKKSKRMKRERQYDVAFSTFPPIPWTKKQIRDYQQNQRQKQEEAPM